MKIASFKKKRETFDYEVVDANGDIATFILLPLPADLTTAVQSFFSGSKSMLSQSQRLRFVNECIVGWKGLTDEDGSDIDHSDKVALQLLQDGFEDLITELVSASFIKRQENEEVIKKEMEALGKLQTK